MKPFCERRASTQQSCGIFPIPKHIPLAVHAPNVAPNEVQLQRISPLILESSQDSDTVTAVHNSGRFRLTDNILWKRVIEEFQDPQDNLGGFSGEASQAEASDDECSFVSESQSKVDIKSCHPSPDGIYQLWNVFTENIDSLTKILYVPTLLSAFEKASRDVGRIPRPFEVLMFAIYSAAVMSLKDDDCIQRLHEPRKVLLPRYISATKAALIRVRFMETANLVVLQALVIYLLSVRDICEPRAVWSLTGVAVRIAQSIALDRDGVFLHLPPFETEMRRRLWWQLKLHDFRTAELCGMPKFRDLHTGSGSTKWPTNVDDNQLFPDMLSLPAEPSKTTDSLFVSLKCELLNFAADRVSTFRRQQKTSNPWNIYTLESSATDIDESLKEIEELLETKYLRYCDPSQPIHLMAMLMARGVINILRFMFHHPRRWSSTEQSPLSERQWFAWHASYFQQWHAIIHVLDTLRADSFPVDAEKAWGLIGGTYTNNPEMLSDMRKPIHVAVGSLCLRAYGSCEATAQNESARPPQEPQFIARLRQHFGAVIAKKLSKNATDAQSKAAASDDAHMLNNDCRMEGQVTARIQSGASYSPKPNAVSPLPGVNLSGSSATHEEDPFWFIYGNRQAGEMNDVNIDLDTMLNRQYIMDDNLSRTLAWEEWDSFASWFCSGTFAPVISRVWGH